MALSSEINSWRSSLPLIILMISRIQRYKSWMHFIGRIIIREESLNLPIFRFGPCEAHHSQSIMELIYKNVHYSFVVSCSVHSTTMVSLSDTGVGNLSVAFLNIDIFFVRTVYHYLVASLSKLPISNFKKSKSSPRCTLIELGDV